MYKGFKKIGSDTYYFYSKSGVMATGWVTNSKKGYKYYFDPSTGVMATGTKTIDGKKYTFGSNGVLDTNQVLLQRQAPGLSRISLPMHYRR